jgi:hypothetical protein
MYYRAAGLGVGGKSAPWAAATCHWIRSQCQNWLAVPQRTIARPVLAAAANSYWFVCNSFAHVARTKRLTFACRPPFVRSSDRESFGLRRSLGSRDTGATGSESKPSVQEKKSKVFFSHPMHLRADASEIEPKSKWFAPRCSYDSSSGPAAGVRFQLMLFDVSLEFSRTFNHAVDQYLAIRPG